MGILVISLVNLIALLLGVTSVLLVLRLAQRDNNPFLNNYLIFLVLEVIAGFCDWIIINWILVLVKGISTDTADLIYHIFWDLLGFPAYLLAFLFLVKAVSHLAGRPISRRVGRLFMALMMVVVVLNYTGLYLRIKDTPYVFSKSLWMIYTLIWPIAYLAYLAFAYFRHLKNSGNRLPGYSRFVLLHFAGFLVWTLLSLLPLNLGQGRHMIIFAFFLSLFIPALYLFFRQHEFKLRLVIRADKSLEENLGDYGFTAREIELALLLMAGKSNQEISDELFVSVQTVKNYISKMYRKAGVSSRIQFVGLFATYPDSIQTR